MRFEPNVILALLPTLTTAFVPSAGTKQASSTVLPVSIGLGPEESIYKSAKDTLVAGVDYEIPNHEEYRLSRRSKLDAECDEWFQTLLDGDAGCLGDIATSAKTALETLPPLVNDIEKPVDDPEWTPYTSERLPWTPLTPAFGTEVFGLPTPRRNAETWRHFDVTGMVRKQYPLKAAVSGLDYAAVQTDLQAKGAWLDDDACQGRLVYIDGIFVPELSKTTEWVTNLDAPPTDEAARFLSRLTDGFTDKLACPVPCNDEMLTSYKKLSGPDHSLGEPYGQFAINTQQGTACFAALNTYKTVGVAHVHCPAGHDAGLSDHEAPKPVLIVNAQTGNGGVTSDDGTNEQSQQGVAYHPRTLVVAEDGSRLSVVQSSVDLDSADFRPKFYNGYTQIFVKGNANVTHSYLEESSGIVTPGVERPDDSFAEGETSARVLEAARPTLQDSHLEAIDVHVMGEKGAYQGAVMALGAAGHSRVALSVSLLQSEAFASVNGFSLAGGAQRADIKTNIHHVAQGTSSRQLQKNMIGGRATGSFRGRIRVERSAQQTDSEQLSRTILLSDKARAWAVPSLEIIADDVQCAHGATVSDLSEEELFYLRSRGLDSATSRNMLMYAFAEDVAANVDPAMLGDVDGRAGLQKRIIRRLENLVPQGERAIKGEFQSI